MIGLPGDFTPVLRFVRAVAFSHSARESAGGYDTVREAFRILDNFNDPLDADEGDDDEVVVEGGGDMYSATQFVVAADASNRVLYYHDQYDRAVKRVDLNEIDFSTLGKDAVHLPFGREPVIVDISP